MGSGVEDGRGAMSEILKNIWSGLAGAALLLVLWRLACLPIWVCGFFVYLQGNLQQRSATAAAQSE